MIENTFAISATFIVYLVVMLAIGVYAYRRTANSEDYFLGAAPSVPGRRTLSRCIGYEWLVVARTSRLCLRRWNGVTVAGRWFAGGYLAELVDLCQTPENLHH